MATTVSSTALEASHVLKTSPGGLASLVVYNNKGSSQFIQLHDAASLPVDTAVPVLIFKLATVSVQQFSWPSSLMFKTGIVVCNSSTADTKTIGSADCFFSAQIE